MPIPRFVEDQETLTTPAEFSLTFTPHPKESCLDLVNRVAESLAGRRAGIAAMFVFGAIERQPVICAALRRVFGEISWPVLWAEGRPCFEHPIAGIQVFALTEVRVERIVRHGQVVGTVYEHDGMRQCLLAGIGPKTMSSNRGKQTQRTLEGMADALGEGGFTFADVVRTWFYNEEILAWYPEFNRVRTELYSFVPFRSGSAPASTGVAGRNPSGSALTTAVLAVQPLDAYVRTEEVASPLQCPAPIYGSSFSRAMEISSSASRRLFISGTASIAPAGETLWRGNTSRQIELTMAVVEAILTSRGYALADLNRTIAYFKHKSDAPFFAAWCAARGVSIPFIPIECDICRDDLLFEIEADAFRLKN